MYSCRGNGIKYNPREPVKVNHPTVGHERSSEETDDSGLALTPAELKLQIDQMEYYERTQQTPTNNHQRHDLHYSRENAVGNHPQSQRPKDVRSSAGNGTRYYPNEPSKSYNAAVVHEGRSEGINDPRFQRTTVDVNHQRKPVEEHQGPIDYLKKKFTELKSKPKPATKINIKSGEGSVLVASKATLSNAKLDLESTHGENVVVGFSGPNEYDVVSADGILQKPARGQYSHTPANQLNCENRSNRHIGGGQYSSGGNGHVNRSVGFGAHQPNGGF